MSNPSGSSYQHEQEQDQQQQQRLSSSQQQQRLSSSQQQQQQQQEERVRERDSLGAQYQSRYSNMAMETSPPAFYPHSVPSRLDQRGAYERPTSTPRRPYDAVLDASPPPSSTKLEFVRNQPSSTIPSYGMPTTPDLSRPFSSSTASSSSSSSLRNNEVSAMATPRRKTSRADQNPYTAATAAAAAASSRSALAPGYGPSSTISSVDNAVASQTAHTSFNSMSASQSQNYYQHGSSSRGSTSKMETDKKQKPSLEGFSRSRNGCKYKLIVVQHPTRARMCGFGDKDRRPLSPTLIVKLVIIDEQTGEEISPWKVNTSLFFLASDLCHPDDLMLSPRNVLVHQHAASIPTSMLQSPRSLDSQQRPTSPYVATPVISSGMPAPLPPLGSLYLNERSRGTDVGMYSQSSMEDQHHHQQQQQQQQQHPSGPSHSPALTTITTEHYTRNLVGAAVTSANVLRDEQDNYAIFFVLQDLSVRTEGVYRIRLMFTNLAQYDGQTNEGISEALAEAYTEPFSVYSPRRFPGMLEPTELSKKLASQGIKIAVRSDKKKRRRSLEGGAQEVTGEVDGLDEEDDE